MEHQLRYVLRENHLKRKFAAGERVNWVLLDTMSADLAEMLGVVGVDGIMIEGEHARFNEDNILHIIRACELHGVTPMIRLRTIHFELVGRLLDLGIQGVLATHVRSRTDVDHLVRSMMYAPLGERGWAQFARVNGYGLTDERAVIENANRQMIVAILIEDIEGVENIDDILSADLIDSIAIGPSDLSASLGIPGQYEHPRFREAIAKVRSAIAASKHAGKGLLGGDAPNASFSVSNGFIARSYFQKFGGTVSAREYGVWRDNP